MKLCWLLMAGIVLPLVSCEKSADNKVLLDTYFNHEVDAATGILQHYTWNDTSRWGGYSQLGDMFEKHGALLAMLDKKPDVDNLADAKVYIIVDPDHEKDNPRPNYMDEETAVTIGQWVEDGGHLLVLANDNANCDIEHINILMAKFGLHFNDTTILQLDLPTREHPDIVYPLEGEIDGAAKMFMRGTCSISGDDKMKRLVWTRDNDVLIAQRNYGKGMVVAVADPWVYNEYIGHNVLPCNYDNASPAEWLVEQLMK